MIGGVTHLGGLPGLPSRITLSAGVAVCHVNVSRWGNPPSRGRVHITFASADIKTARFILKFFFHSLSGKIPLNKLSHHCSVLPEFLHILTRRRLILLRMRRSRATEALYCCVAFWRRLCIIKSDNKKPQH